MMAPRRRPSAGSWARWSWERRWRGRRWGGGLRRCCRQGQRLPRRGLRQSLPLTCLRIRATLNIFLVHAVAKYNITIAIVDLFAPSPYYAPHAPPSPLPRRCPLPRPAASPFLDRHRGCDRGHLGPHQRHAYRSLPPHPALTEDCTLDMVPRDTQPPRVHHSFPSAPWILPPEVLHVPTSTPRARPRPPNPFATMSD
jgi:hypothetical protein